MGRYSYVSVVGNLPGPHSGLTMPGLHRLHAPAMRPATHRRRAQPARKSRVAGVRRALPTLLKGLAVLGLLAGLAWGGVEGWRWLTTSPRFDLTEVAYHGNAHAADAELTRLGGVLLGQNLFALDTDALARAMEAHPWVKSAKVRRRLPSQLDVTVEEYAPVALLAMGDLYLVDADARPFKRLAAGDDVDLPLVTGLPRERFVEERDLALRDLATALDALAAWEASGVGQAHAVSEVRLGATGLQVVTVDGLEVHLGEDALVEKLARLERVQAALAERHATAAVIRLDDRNRPTRVAVQLSAPGSERGRSADH